MDAPLVSNQLHGGKTPIIPQAELKALGFAAANYPTAGLFAAARALEGVFTDHVMDRRVQAPLYAFDDFVEKIGFRDVRDFEKKYADLLRGDG